MKRNSRPARAERRQWRDSARAIGSGAPEPVTPAPDSGALLRQVLVLGAKIEHADYAHAEPSDETRAQLSKHLLATLNLMTSLGSAGIPFAAAADFNSEAHAIADAFAIWSVAVTPALSAARAWGAWECDTPGFADVTWAVGLFEGKVLPPYVPGAPAGRNGYVDMLIELHLATLLAKAGPPAFEQPTEPTLASIHNEVTRRFEHVPEGQRQLILSAVVETARDMQRCWT